MGSLLRAEAWNSPGHPQTLAVGADVIVPASTSLPACRRRLPAWLQGQPLLRLGQYVLNPLQRALADNCHLTRDPLPLIQATPGFGSSSGDGSPVTAMRFAVDGAGLIGPHVAGIARKAAAAPDSSSSPPTA